MPQAIGQYAIGIAGAGVPQSVLEKLDKYRLPASAIDGYGVIKPHIIKEVVNPTFTIQEREELNSVLSDIKTYVDQMRIKFVTGDEPFTNWDSYVSKIKQMDVDRMLKIYSIAYERWQKN